MERIHEDRIVRNEQRINSHSTRIKELERTQVSIIKDTENFLTLLVKLEKTIETLNATVIRMESSPVQLSYKLESLNGKLDDLSKDVDVLKKEDGEKWKHYSKFVIGAIITTALGYIFGGM